MQVRNPFGLFVLSASPDKDFKVAAGRFETITKPMHSEDSSGCGFISEEMLIEQNLCICTRYPLAWEQNLCMFTRHPMAGEQTQPQQT